MSVLPIGLVRTKLLKVGVSGFERWAFGCDSGFRKRRVNHVLLRIFVDANVLRMVQEAYS